MLNRFFLQSRFASVTINSVLGPPRQRDKDDSDLIPYISEVPQEATHEERLRALELPLCQLKKPFKGLLPRLGSC